MGVKWDGENVFAGMDEPGLRIHKNEEPYGSIALWMRREKGISEFSIAPYLKPRDSVRRIATHLCIPYSI